MPRRQRKRREDLNRTNLRNHPYPTNKGSCYPIIDHEEEEESPLPPLSKQRKANRPVITFFIMKTPIKTKEKSEGNAAAVGNNR